MCENLKKYLTIVHAFVSIQNSAIATATIEESKALASDLLRGMEANCQALDEYQILVESNAQKMQERTEEDRASILASTNVSFR